MIFSKYRLQNVATKAVHQANINATILKKLKVIRPSLEEQRQIVLVLSSLNKKLEVEMKMKAKLEDIKKIMTNVLLCGKIRVRRI